MAATADWDGTGIGAVAPKKGPVEQEGSQSTKQGVEPWHRNGSRSTGQGAVAQR